MNRFKTARCAFISADALIVFSTAELATEDKSARWDFIKEYIEVKGAGPFDEVWFLQLNLKPNRIWPV